MNKQDFESKYSGLEIDEAVGKGLGLNPENSGWVKLPSTAETPVDIDTIFNPGNYMTVFVTGTIPTELVGVSPINFTVCNVPWGAQPNLAQCITYADLSYYRYRGTDHAWNATWTRALTSNYIYSNDETTPPANPESGTIWVHPAAGGKTMTMKVYYPSVGWRDLRAEGLMTTSVYDPTNQKTDLFALIDQKFVALKIDADAMKAHMADKIIHITQEERVAWHNKVTNEAFNTAKETLKTEITTQITAQTGNYEARLTEFNTRVTNLQNTLNAHAANAIIHVNQTDINTWNAKADANHTHLNDNRVTIDAKDVTSGIFDLARIPKEAFSEVVEVNTVADMYKLTKAQVQNGDTVHVKTPSSFYFVVDDTKLTSAAGYTIYSVGVLDEILWANIRNKPTTIAGFGITDAYTKKEVDEKVKASIDIVSGELNKQAAMINYAVTNDILQDVQDVFYPQENLNILQGGRRDNQLYPYAESVIWDTNSSGALIGAEKTGFNEWSVLPKYSTDDFMYGGPFSNQPYRIPKIPHDYNPSSFKTKFPEEFVDESMVSVKYYHWDTTGKPAAGPPPQVPAPALGTDNTAIRCLTDWQQIYCGSDPSAPIAVKKIKSYQIMSPNAPYNYSSHICIIRKQSDIYATNCGHLAIAYENASRDTIEILENPFLSPTTAASVSERHMSLKRRNWQGFMVNPNAPSITLGGATSAINDTTLNFSAVPTNITTSIDILLNSAGGFNIYDFDIDAQAKTLVVFGSVRISMNDGGTTASPKLTAGTKNGSTAIPARSVPAVLICDILYANNHPGADTVNKPPAYITNPGYLGNYIVGFLPVSLQVCPPSGNSANVYANRFGLNFFDTDAAMSTLFNSPEKQVCVKRIMPSTTASPPMVTNDRRSAFMLYADHHTTATDDTTPYPISFIFTSWNPNSQDTSIPSSTLRRSAFATAEIPEYWAKSTKFPVESNRLLPNLQVIQYEGIQKNGSRYKSSMLVGSLASAKDTFDGTLCPWYMVDPYIYFPQQNTTQENSRLPNIKYRRTIQFWFGAHEPAYRKAAFRMTDANHLLTVNGATLQNARDCYYFFQTPDVIDSNNKCPVYILVNGIMNRWAAVRIAWESTTHSADTAVYQETLDPLPADTLIASMYPRQMQLVNKSTEPPTPWNQFYHLPISDIGIIPYTIRPYDALLRDDYGTKLREMTEAIDRQRIRTGVIWAKRGNLVEMTGMTTIISWMPMGTPYTDTAFLGTVNSEYYVGYITEYGEVHKRKLIAGGVKMDLTNFHPRAIFSAAIWYDCADYGSDVHLSPMPEQVGLLGYNDKSAAKCLERVNIPNFYSFVASMNTPLNLASAVATGGIFIDSNVTIPDTFCSNKESFIKVLGGGLEVVDTPRGDFSQKLIDGNMTQYQRGCQLALLYNKPVAFGYGPDTTNLDSLIVAGSDISTGRYIKIIDAAIYNPTNITGKRIVYRELVHSSDGVPVYFAICGKSGDVSSYEAVMIIPKYSSATPEIVRVPWPKAIQPWQTGYYRTSHQWMYLKGKGYRCEGHPAFLNGTHIIVVQMLARAPKDTTIPRIQIIEDIPVNLGAFVGDYIYGTIGQGSPSIQKNPTTDMDIAPIFIDGNHSDNGFPDSIHMYAPPIDETDLPYNANISKNDKNYFPVYQTTKLFYPTMGTAPVPLAPGEGTKHYAYPGFKLAKTRDLGIVGADGSWYVTMTASRALSEQINFGRMVQDAYTWKNQAQFQNTQIQSMWKTIHDAQPMLQSILNLV